MTKHQKIGDFFLLLMLAGAGDELQGIGDALDQVVLLDHGHGARSSSGG